MAKSLKGLDDSKKMARVRNGLKSGVKGLGYWAAVDWMRKHRPEALGSEDWIAAYAADKGGKR